MDVAKDAAISTVTQLNKNGEVNVGELAFDVAAGKLAGNLGDKAKMAKQNSQTGKVLNRQADHDRRVAGEYPRASRKERAEKSAEKANSYGDKSATATSTFISSSVEESFKQFNKEDN